jgi:hypothetical protein
MSNLIRHLKAFLSGGMQMRNTGQIYLSETNQTRVFELEK